MPTPWLSLLIPVYRVEPWLAACVDSVRGQADAGVEVLLLDDASPDRSGDLARRLVADWPQARVLSHERNRGLSAARNSLLAQARGDYVWFLDSDDMLLPGAIAGLRAAIDQGAPDLVLCDFAVVRERARLKHRLRGERHRRTFAGTSNVTREADAALAAGLLEIGELHSWSKIARREVWQQASFPEGRYFEDMAVIPALLAHARSYRHVDRPWVGYRQREGSILTAVDAERIGHLLDNMLALRHGLAALPVLDDPAARFALEHFCARSLIAARRHLRRLGSAAPELEAKLREACAEALPDGLDALLRGYRRRGWLLRALRAKRQLRALLA
jgi:glycosyltransferase involved in cell wall biosynthesis